VVLCAGQFSSRILEFSGIGNAAIIGPILEGVGRKMRVDIPGVGESLTNDGVVIVTMTANPNDLNTGTSADLYAGGAFLPYPGGPLTYNTTSARFSQWFNFDTYTPGPTYLPQFGPVIDPGGYGDVESPTTHLFSIGAILLNVSSTGFAHIQSADPFDAPYATTNAIQDPVDQDRWNTLLQVRLFVGAIERALLACCHCIPPFYSSIIEGVPYLKSYSESIYHKCRVAFIGRTM